jgi:hypothetical protein
MLQTQDFDSWTSYDEWLIQNYNDYGITSVEEKDGKIHAEYMDKAEWTEEAKRIEEEAQTADK